MQRIMKNSLRRVLAFLAAIALVAVLLPATTSTTAFAAESATIVVDVPEGGLPEGGYQPGDTFTIPFKITQNPGFCASLFEVLFDADALELTAFSGAGSVYGSTYIGNPATNRVGNINLFAVENINDTGLLFTATFTVKEGATEGDSTISLRPALGAAANFTDKDLKPVPYAVESLDVAIIPEAEEPEPEPDPDPEDIPQIVIGNAAEAQNPGDTFTVDVSILNNPGIYAAAWMLDFDDEALELVSASAEGKLLEGGLVVDGLPSSIGYVGGLDLENITEDGVLFTLTFKVLDEAEEGTYEIFMDLLDGNPLNLVNADAEPVEVAYLLGTVDVEEAEEPPEPPVGDAAQINIGTGEGWRTDTDVVVPVYIVDNPGFAAAVLAISYDTDKLEIKNILNADALTKDALVWVHGFNEDDSVYTVNLINGYDLEVPNIEDDGKLFDIVFEIKSAAAAGEDLAVSIGLKNDYTENFTNADEEDVAVSFTAGKVTVKSPIEPEDALYDFTPKTATYDGTAKAVTVTKEDEKAGDVTAVYYGGSTTAPTNAGTYAITIDTAATPKYTAKTGLALGTLTISKAAAPEITWPTAAAITYGDPLSDAALSFTSNEYGTFDWDDEDYDEDAILDAGTYTYDVTFTPSADTLANYETISPLTKPVTVTVGKAAIPGTITWPTAAAITYGDPLSDAELSFTSNTYGTFDWDDEDYDGDAILDAGTYGYDVTFTPSANYLAYSPATQEVEVTVNKAPAPTITWPTASDILKGQTLASSTLTPSSNEYGTFAWTDDTIAPPVPGGSYEVTFTPSASTLLNYEAITPLTQDVDVRVISDGDVDGDGKITAKDALIALKYVYGQRTLTDAEFAASDIDGDGEITITDVTNIIRKAAGLPVTI
ncbi:MAG: dockerin type I domain-containing protein [Clostridiales Family XIII bacterium]|jgi:hypothetical protein|nr:dockerin type I domain-containing protein [Clostridiales Family XIII bacterium]